MSKRKFPDKKLGRHRKGVDWKNDPERVIISKFGGYCSSCFEDISAGEWVFWSSETKEIRHQKCPTPDPGPKPKKVIKIIPTDHPVHTRTPPDSDLPAHVDEVRSADRCSHWDRLVQGDL